MRFLHKLSPLGDCALFALIWQILLNPSSRNSEKGVGNLLTMYSTQFHDWCRLSLHHTLLAIRGKFGRKVLAVRS
jgi:hypothetical protein